MNRDYNVICDRSGFVCKRSECEYTWYGTLVRKDFWEPRQTQDILPAKDDRQELPDARPVRDDPPQGPAYSVNDII